MHQAFHVPTETMIDFVMIERILRSHLVDIFLFMVQWYICTHHVITVEFILFVLLSLRNS